MCHQPMAVVEISSYLELPLSVVKILLCDLLDTGRITARQPSSTRANVRRRRSAASGGSKDPATLPDPEFLKKVLVGLHNL
jgi:hypothetical protein